MMLKLISISRSRPLDQNWSTLAFAEPLIVCCSTGSLGMVRLLSRDLSHRRVLHQPFIVYYNLGQITLG